MRCWVQPKARASTLKPAPSRARWRPDSRWRKAGVLNDDGTATAGFPPRPAAAAAAGLAEALDAELEDEANRRQQAAVNGLLLSEPELSRTGDDFLLGGSLVPLPLCCC